MGGKFARLDLFAHSVLSHFPFAKCSAFAFLKSSVFDSVMNSFWIHSKTSLFEDLFSAN